MEGATCAAPRISPASARCSGASPSIVAPRLGRRASFVSSSRSACGAGLAAVSAGSRRALTRGPEPDQGPVRGADPAIARPTRATDVDATRVQIMVISAAALLVLLLAFAVALACPLREQRGTRSSARPRPARGRRAQRARCAAAAVVRDGARRGGGVRPRPPVARRVSVPELAAELLVADSSRAHFRQTTTHRSRRRARLPGDDPDGLSRGDLGSDPDLAQQHGARRVSAPAGPAGRRVLRRLRAGQHRRQDGRRRPRDRPDRAARRTTRSARVKLIARKVGERVGHAPGVRAIGDAGPHRSAHRL